MLLCVIEMVTIFNTGDLRNMLIKIAKENAIIHELRLSLEIIKGNNNYKNAKILEITDISTKKTLP